MKISIEETENVVDLAALLREREIEVLPGRLWNGVTERGVKCLVIVNFVIAQLNEDGSVPDLSEFDCLQSIETDNPSLMQEASSVGLEEKENEGR